jgi:hypothetical protein
MRVRAQHPRSGIHVGSLCDDDCCGGPFLHLPCACQAPVLRHVSLSPPTPSPTVALQLHFSLSPLPSHVSSHLLSPTAGHAARATAPPTDGHPCHPSARAPRPGVEEVGGRERGSPRPSTAPGPQPRGCAPAHPPNDRRRRIPTTSTATAKVCRRRRREASMHTRQRERTRRHKVKVVQEERVERAET